MRIRWRGLELPTRVLREEGASTSTYGRFIVEPFERGFGTTVGNSLRRILLSSLEGAAVTHVRIKGADHEFKTLTGVVEDVTELILNIKSLIVQSSSDEPKSMRVRTKGRKGETVEVRAAQIEADAAIDIINQDQLIATLTDDVEFDVEMTVGRGRGYAAAEDHKAVQGEQIIGLIPVDSVYSPVTRVRYRVVDTRVGQRTNYDRLIMEIWTNGTVAPEMALVEAAKILRKHLNPFVQYFELSSGQALEQKAEPQVVMVGDVEATTEDKLAMPVSTLDLSVRAGNCLATANIATIGDLLKWDEPGLLKLRSFGKTSLREVKRKLADMGLALRSEPEMAEGDGGVFPPGGFGGGFSTPSPFGPLPGSGADLGLRGTSPSPSGTPTGGFGRSSGSGTNMQVGVLPLPRLAPLQPTEDQKRNPPAVPPEETSTEQKETGQSPNQ